MSDQDIKPQALMRHLQTIQEDDTRYANLSHTARRVKIAEGETWVLRFLPYEMGKEKSFYVTQARHWFNKAPLTCPRWTPPNWGGNQDAPCPVCDLSMRLNQSPDEKIRQISFQAEAKLARLMWAIVYSIIDSRQRVDEMSLEDVLNPYQFELTKNTWADFKKYYTPAARRGQFILDIETGRTFEATGTGGNKGIALQPLDPSHIFEDMTNHPPRILCDPSDPNFDKYTAKIWSKLRPPVISMSSEQHLQDMADKFERMAMGGSGSERRRRDDRQDDRRERRRYTEDQDQTNTRQPSRRHDDPELQEQEPAPSSRRRQEIRDDPEPETAAAPTRRHPEPEPAVDPAPTRRRQQPQNEQVPEQEQETPAPARRSTAVAQEQEQPASPPARRTLAGPPSARAAVTATENGHGDDGDLGPQTAPQRSSRPVTETVDEEDNVAEEQRDPAPPTKGAVDEAPPAVSTSAPAPKSSVLKARLQNLNRKGT